MFQRDLDSGQIVRPFSIQVNIDGYWLTRLKSRPLTPAMRTFRAWLVETIAADPTLIPGSPP